MKNEMVMSRAFIPPQADHTTRNMTMETGPAKRWGDELDKFWSDTIWQRTAQDWLTWIGHAEAFAQSTEH